MSKKYDARLLKNYRSYKTKDICRLFRVKKLHEQTIRGWINDGKLDAFWHGKTLYIYGAVLKQFLTDRNNQRKSPLEFNQFRCWKCKATVTPLNHTIEKLTLGRNGCPVALGVCKSCGHEIKRIYKADAEQEILRTFTVVHNQLTLLSDSLCSIGKTNVDDTPQMASNEPMENKPPDKNTSAGYKANIKPSKNTTSTETTHTPPLSIQLFGYIMNKIDTRHNQANEIIKYKFFEQLENGKDGKDPKTVDQFVNAIHEFEVATGFKDFKKFTSDWAIQFKNYLNDKINKQTGKTISKSLYFHYITFVRRFFEWVVDNEKEYAKIGRKEIDFLNVTRNDKNKARATNHQESHDIADILVTLPL